MGFASVVPTLREDVGLIEVRPGPIEVRRTSADRGLETRPFMKLNGWFTDVALAHEVLVTLSGRGPYASAGFPHKYLPRLIQIWRIAPVPECIWCRSLANPSPLPCIGIFL